MPRTPANSARPSGWSSAAADTLARSQNKRTAAIARPPDELRSAREPAIARPRLAKRDPPKPDSSGKRRRDKAPEHGLEMGSYSQQGILLPAPADDLNAHRQTGLDARRQGRNGIPAQ